MYKKNLSCRPFKDKNKRAGYLCKSLENFESSPILQVILSQNHLYILLNYHLQVYHHLHII